jgi:hypothetical protein
MECSLRNVDSDKNGTMSHIQKSIVSLVLLVVTLVCVGSVTL